jgi:hypothetical protein
MAIWKLPLLLLATAATGSLTDATQKVLGTAPPAPPRIDPDPAVLAALAAHTDPIDAFLSLEVFTHPLRQSSVIARFEPKVRTFSAPLTIIGAHQDSMNYLFPLLPAPGADDDCAGTSASSRPSASSPPAATCPATAPSSSTGTPPRRAATSAARRL